MLGGLLFAFWRIAEIITLIPVIGMLVSALDAHVCRQLLMISGLLCQWIPEQQPADAQLHPCPLHRLRSRLCLGHSYPSATRLHAPIRALCCLYRPLFRWCPHRRRVRAARHRRRQLFQLHWLLNLRQPGSFRLLWRRTRQPCCLQL